MHLIQSRQVITLASTARSLVLLAGLCSDDQDCNARLQDPTTNAIGLQEDQDVTPGVCITPIAAGSACKVGTGELECPGLAWALVVFTSPCLGNVQRTQTLKDLVSMHQTAQRACHREINPSRGLSSSTVKPA